MHPEPEPLFYVITYKPKEGGGGNEWVHLYGRAWPSELGIDHIRFRSMRAAAYFAQHHAAGREALLRVDMHPYGFHGERHIPPIEEIPVPAAHEDTGEDFFEFFRRWPMRFELERRKRAVAKQPPPPQQRSSKINDHPASFRWTPPDAAVPPDSARDRAIAEERARLQAILATDEPDGKWSYSPKRKDWKARVDHAQDRLARLNRGEWPLDEPDDTPY